jgi:hypothetical protein
MEDDASGSENNTQDNSPFLALETRQLHVDIIRELTLLRCLEQYALAKKCFLHRKSMK